DGTRTRDRLITNQLLYQLSYTSKEADIIHKNILLQSPLAYFFCFLAVLFLLKLFSLRLLSKPVYLVLNG
ncbi:MAG: hypothetical protein CG438_1446, partial [Methylococcaceae bacterium NSP1-1]